MSDPRENDVSGGRRRTAPVPDGDPLSTSPFDGDLGEETTKAPRARRLPGPTTLLCAAVVLAAGFVIGVQTDRHTGRQGSNAAAPSPPGAGFAGGGTRGGGSQAGGGGATTGTVQKIDGKTIYVRTAGGVVQVKVTGTTKISTLRSGAAKNLKSGASVVVQGTQAKDGSVTATSVSQAASSGG